MRASEDLDAIAESGAVIATNPSSNLHLASGVAPIGEAIRRGCRVALGVDASAFDEDDDIVREMRLGHFLHGGWGSRTVIERGDWLDARRRQRPLRQRRAGRRRASRRRAGRHSRARPRRLDRDAVMPVEPIDLVFARATAAHVARLFVAGEEIVRDGTLVARRSRRRRGGAARAIPLEGSPRARHSSTPGAISSRPSPSIYRSGLGCC